MKAIWEFIKKVARAVFKVITFRAIKFWKDTADERKDAVTGIGDDIQKEVTGK